MNKWISYFITLNNYYVKQMFTFLNRIRVNSLYRLSTIWFARSNPIWIFTTGIRLLATYLKDIYQEVYEKLSTYINPKDIFLIYTKTPENGDFAIHTNRIKDPQILTSILTTYNSPSINAVTLINQNIFFKVDKKAISKKIIKTIMSEGSKYGYQEQKNKLYAIDYSSPNIAKKFHPGHLRTTVLGNFIKNILHANGYRTHSINYLGDWGKQFGLIGIGFARYGSEEEMEKDPIKHLYDVYVKINKDAKEDAMIDEEAKRWFMELENGNEEYVKVWRRFRETSIEKYKQLYKILNCEFDEYSGESFYSKTGKEAIDTLRKRSDLEEGFVVEDKDGSIYLETKYGKLCVIKKDGSTLYSTRDITCAYDRVRRLAPDKIVYVVATQQDLYFKQLFDILKKIGLEKEGGENIFQHISYGMVNGMSTRKGTIVFLEDIINEAKEVMLAKMKSNDKKFNEIANVDKTCEILAVSALIIQDFNAKRIKNYDFNMERNTETSGFTGPYLQYLHCRLMSLEDKNKGILVKDNLDNSLESKNENNNIKMNEINANLEKLDINEKNIKTTNIKGNQDLTEMINNLNIELLDDKVYEILFFLLKYPLTIEKCMANYEPSTMVTYLMDLCKKVNGIISDLRVMGVERELALVRLFFYKSVRIVVGNGLRILGITPLERM